MLRSPTFSIRNRFAHILACGSDSRCNIRVDNFTMIRDPIYGGLKQVMNDDSLHWITVDLESWKGHRAYLEFNDVPTPDPSDEVDKKFSPQAYLAVSRVVFSDNSSPPAWQAPPLPSFDKIAQASSVDQLAGLYQNSAAIAAVKAWAEDRIDREAPAQLAWLDWLMRNSLLEGGPAEDPDQRSPKRGPQLNFKKSKTRVPVHARAVGMIDGTGVDENVFIRGNHKTPGEIVPRRFLEALGGSEKTRFTQGSGRLELARSITDPSNPFLARVMVNRVWLHLFGRGIVPTPG